MRVAVSTKDGIMLTNDHFGEGEHFLIYEVSKEGYRLLEKRKNTSPEEEEHGSAKKAQGIREILQDIPVLLGFQFGPNILRIKDHFLPIVSRKRKIERALELLCNNFTAIEEEFHKGRGKVIILNVEGAKILKLSEKNAKDF